MDALFQMRVIVLQWLRGQAVFCALSLQKRLLLQVQRMTLIGYSNTQAIMDHGGGAGDTAAHLCTSIQITAVGFPCSVGDVCYEDWYVPEKNELSCLYNNKDAIPDISDSDYWSSTEVDEDSAYILDFSTNSFQAVPKNSLHIIFRCVRSVSN